MEIKYVNILMCVCEPHTGEYTFQQFSHIGMNLMCVKFSNQIN